jgi:hypothetical protein
LICAFGSIAWVYTNSPQAGVTGWTKYTFPTGFDVEGMVELDGILYLRSGTAVYKFDPSYTGETGYSWTARFPYNHVGSWGRQKSWLTLETASSGRMGISFYVDPRDETRINVCPTLTGSRFAFGKVPLAMIAPSVSPVFTGTTAWTMDSFTLTHRKGNS